MTTGHLVIPRLALQVLALLWFNLQIPDALNFGYCPHTVAVYSRATTKGRYMSIYYDYCSTDTEWGQHLT